MAIWLVGPALIQRLPPINEAAAVSVITVPVNQVIETDLAQTFTVVGIDVVGQCAEIDTAQPFNRLKQRSLSQCVETDLVQFFSHSKNKAIGQCNETDSTQPFSHAGPIILNFVAEEDSAQSFAHTKNKAIGLNTETDLAQTITWSPKKRLMNQTTESDIALRFTRLKDGIPIVDGEEGKNVFVGAGLAVKGLRRRKRELLWWA